MTLTDDLHDTAAALRSGWPIQNLNRARRVRAEQETTAVKKLPCIDIEYVGQGSMDFDRDDVECIAADLEDVADLTDAQIVSAIESRASEYADDQIPRGVRVRGIGPAHIAAVRAAIADMKEGDQ